MKESKLFHNAWKKFPFPIVGILTVLAVMLLLLWNSITTSYQSFTTVCHWPSAI